MISPLTIRFDEASEDRAFPSAKRIAACVMGAATQAATLRLEQARRGSWFIVEIPIGRASAIRPTLVAV